MSLEVRLDALVPQEMAEKAEEAGVRKAALPIPSMFALAMLAGAFIGLGAMFATTTGAAASSLPYGVGRLLVGLTFCLGLILVVVAGAELFTGNNLIVMAWASRKISTGSLLRNWLIVYLGNFVGSHGTAILVFLSKQYMAGTGSVGEAALKTAVSKVNLGFVQALALGVLCNALVCLAIWLTFSARSVTDKILAILFPISAFVAAGFEHSVANMYFIPYALLIKAFDPAFAVAHKIDISNLTWGALFLKNLLPVTLGNIMGGSMLVAAMYWFIYLRKQKSQ
jgi:formate transporter